MFVASMSEWSPAEWSIFFVAVGVLAGTLTTSIISIINAAKAVKRAESASTQAVVAEAKAEDAKQHSIRNTDRIVDVAAKMEPPK